jgi:hypothetical protein
LNKNFPDFFDFAVKKFRMSNLTPGPSPTLLPILRKQKSFLDGSGIDLPGTHDFLIRIADVLKPLRYPARKPADSENNSKHI